MSVENDLLRACRILFGEDVQLSREFLEYLQEEGIQSAFRRKALEMHPDRAALFGLTAEESRTKFHMLQQAREALRRHVALRAMVVAQPKDVLLTGRCSQLPPVKLPFGRFLYRLGRIELRDLLQALARQRSSRLRIGELAVCHGYLPKEAIVDILRHSVNNAPFGRTAVSMRLLSAAEVTLLLRRQRLQQKKIGRLFIEQGLLSEEEVSHLLVRQRAHNRHAADEDQELP